MEVISLQPYVPRGIMTAKVTLFLQDQETTRQTDVWFCVSVSPVFRFSPHPPCLSPSPLLSAGAGLDGHVGINLEHRVPGLVLVEHGQGIHLLWDAAGLRNPRDDANGSDYALDGGVVGRPRHLGEFQ